ncbi:MAG: hypothetical protein HKN49_09860, partial [Gammaproteobacteria bacterium]|nr:hypothetical protein [Gammaproteobacteria bacterium]
MKLAAVVAIFVWGVLFADCSYADSQTDRAIWVANAKERLLTERRWREIDYLKGANWVLKESGIVVSVVEAVRTKSNAELLRRNKGYSPDYLDYRTPEAIRAKENIDAMRSMGGIFYKLGESSLNSLREVSYSAENQALILRNKSDYQLYRGGSVDIQSILEDAYDLAQENPKYKEVIDETWGSLFGADIGDSADSIIEN